MTNDVIKMKPKVYHGIENNDWNNSRSYFILIVSKYHIFIEKIFISKNLLPIKEGNINICCKS